MADNPLIIVHGWSDSADSFTSLGQFLQKSLNRNISHINLADWVSMNDEVTYLDLAEAMEREWRKLGLPVSSRSADLVVHSTGALVVREWLTRYYKPDNNPVDHLLMLAPANFGSPLAHKGRAFYGRIIKGWRTAFQTGTHLLNGLELGSPYTWELAEKDILSNAQWYGKNRIKASVFVGNQGYKGVRAAANEDGSDGTVRISTANLNAVRMVVDFSKNPTKPKVSFSAPPKGHQSAFCILDGDNHGSIIMKSDGSPKNKKAGKLFVKALTVDADGWDDWCLELEKICRPLENHSARTDSDKHTFQNTVVRVNDNVGNPVEDYFIEFYEDDSDTGLFGALFHRNILQKVHKPESGSNYRSMYIDVTLLHDRIDKIESDSLKICVRAEPVIESNPDKSSVMVGYPDDPACIQLNPDQVKYAFAPNRTLLVDIIIKRELINALVIKPLTSFTEK